MVRLYADLPKLYYFPFLIFPLYLRQISLGPYNAGPNFTSAPLTLPLPPFRAGVKRASRYITYHLYMQSYENPLHTFLDIVGKKLLIIFGT